MQSTSDSNPPSGMAMETAERWLERHGWLRSVAGEDNFRRACKAVMHYSSGRKNGLLLLGDPGCGKTFLARCLYDETKSRLRPDEDIDRKVWIDCCELASLKRAASPDDARMLGLTKEDGTERDWEQKIAFLDDIGNERMLTHYGTTYNLVSDFILRFYNEWKEPYDERMYGPMQFGNHFVATSNFSEEELDQHFGTRVMDRVFDMCAVVHLTGPSRRNLTILD